MTSSLRNSLHRKNHKERGQLAHRSRLGLLEKHKDYVLRARDYHSKKDRITRLRQKAAVRNKDEFYFAMNKQKTEGGVHIQDRGNEALPVDIVKVLKSQDENYIRTMRTAGLKKIDRIKGQLSTLADLVNPISTDDGSVEGLDGAELDILREAGIIAGPSTSNRRRRASVSRPASKHIIFADSEEQVHQLSSSSSRLQPNLALSKSSEEPHEDHDKGWKTPESKGKKRKPVQVSAVSQNDSISLQEQHKEASEHRSRLLKELSARLHRDQQLRYAERELEMQKLLMGKGGSRKLNGVEKVEEDNDNDEDDDMDGGSRRNKKVDEKTWKPRVYKWKLERKR
ncbi:hypothetical protein QCA50_002541 [Cerrena zonata]|uniref:U3 small nucleolar RNA-associated protein 11 n=1 Tax=Cerrena zonata TaxID=2478898 RepID=A0AAW0GZG2_9APHY